MKTAILFVLAIALGSAFKISTLTPKTYINWPYAICQVGPWNLSALLLDQRPSKNINLTVIALGKTTTDVNFDHVDFEGKINGVSTQNETLPYEASLTTGSIMGVKHTYHIPISAPSGIYVNSYWFKGAGDESLGCLSYTFTI